MFKYIQKRAYRAGLQAAYDLIDAKVKKHEAEKSELSAKGMSGDEIQACITCLVAIGREIIKLMSK